MSLRCVIAEFYFLLSSFLGLDDEFFQKRAFTRSALRSGIVGNVNGKESSLSSKYTISESLHKFEFFLQSFLFVLKI